MSITSDAKPTKPSAELASDLGKSEVIGEVKTLLIRCRQTDGQWLLGDGVFNHALAYAFSSGRISAQKESLRREQIAGP